MQFKNDCKKLVSQQDRYPPENLLYLLSIPISEKLYRSHQHNYKKITLIKLKIQESYKMKLTKYPDPSQFHFYRYFYHTL